MRADRRPGSSHRSRASRAFPGHPCPGGSGACPAPAAQEHRRGQDNSAGASPRFAGGAPAGHRRGTGEPVTPPRSAGGAGEASTACCGTSRAARCLPGAIDRVCRVPYDVPAPSVETGAGDGYREPLPFIPGRKIPGRPLPGRQAAPRAPEAQPVHPARRRGDERASACRKTGPQAPDAINHNSGSVALIWPKPGNPYAGTCRVNQIKTLEGRPTLQELLNCPTFLTRHLQVVPRGFSHLLACHPENTCACHSGFVQ